MRKLKVLELFSGTRSVSKAFEAHGHETFCVEWDRQFEADLYMDIGKLKAEKVLKLFGRPDVIWMSPQCDTFSVAAISKHRRENGRGGGLVAISEKAMQDDRVDVNCMRLLRDLQPLAFWIENPRGGMRRAEWIQWCPRHTVTYCQYTMDLPLEQRRMKPTDLWCNIPNPGLKPPCNNGDPCHVRAPRGARTGTQGLSPVDRARIPEHLCEHIVEITEDYIERLDLANEYLVSLGRKPITPTLEE